MCFVKVIALDAFGHIKRSKKKKENVPGNLMKINNLISDKNCISSNESILTLRFIVDINILGDIK